ncbi:MAG: hypothetical protein ACJA0Q_000945 [Saprospiraceae bacterium]|jgi:hypothetical protein
MGKVYRILNVVLFSIYPILHLYVGNSGFLIDGGLLLPLLVSLVFSLLLYRLVLKFLKNKNNSVYVTVLILFWLQIYGHVYYTLMDGFSISYEAFKHRYFIVVYSGVLGLLLYAIRNKNEVSIKLVKVTAVIAIMLTAQFGYPIYKVFSVKQKEKNQNPLPPVETGLPDVYYIVADSYPNQENLSEFYNFDNSSFLQALRNIGFQVQDHAKSNYPYTYFSLASSLNMEYINYFEDSVRFGKHGDDFPFTKIYKNKVATHFKSKGYRYVFYKSAYAQLNNQSEVDLYIDNSLTINQFHSALLELSVFSVFNTHLLQHSKVYNICVKAFENLSESSRIEGSKFVFFHCLPPHPPLVFSADGSYNKSSKDVKNRYQLKNEYVAQVSYVNTAVLLAVQNILSTSKQKPIIIIQGDHGTCSEEEFEDELKWSDVPTKTLLRERYGVLNAVYSPEDHRVNFKKDHTPVNSFKLVFNSLFDEKMVLDSNVYYFSKYRVPYDFQSFRMDDESLEWGVGSRQ